MDRIYRIWILIVAVVFLYSCDDPHMEEKRVVRTVKIAVVLPEIRTTDGSGS